MRLLSFSVVLLPTLVRSEFPDGWVAISTIFPTLPAVHTQPTSLPLPSLSPPSPPPVSTLSHLFLPPVLVSPPQEANLELRGPVPPPAAAAPPPAAAPAGVVPGVGGGLGPAAAQPASVTPDQVSPVTTMYIGSVQVVFTQTFASVPSQLSGPQVGSVGMGTLTGTVGAVKTVTAKKGTAAGRAGVSGGKGWSIGWVGVLVGLVAWCVAV